ncbi:uncharacterized protein BDZ99DRAFT_463996 [Mytilinidion resinicola]|uniref:Uncharacterized protein n=1 Tax=Mytilinidion resinicola TaxID=574789 RepID=A0A6A6YMK6_9PEZI|nr:uncharacterized protein BDZ99DRAFT_463996 [Mytilinidion resinicola]KAF2809215.1 hypothetical protein BDZ99DRAFT_463996 [Mytilinidion resinicola]
MDPVSDTSTTAAWESRSTYEFGTAAVFSSPAQAEPIDFSFKPASASTPSRIPALEVEVRTLREAFIANTAESKQLRETIAARDKTIASLSEQEAMVFTKGLELRRLRMEIKARDEIIAELPKTVKVSKCCCDGLQKELQKCQEELEAKDKKIIEIKVFNKKEVAAKDRHIESQKKQHRADVEGLNKRIKALDVVIDNKDLAIQAEAKLHRDLKVKLQNKEREANALTKKVAEMTKEAARLSKLKEKTWQKLDTSRAVATELEQKLKHEEETRHLQVRKGIEEVVAPVYSMSGSELKANDLLYETVQAKDKKIEELQSEIAALNISADLMAESEEKLRKQLAERSAQNLDTNANFTVVQGKKGAKGKKPKPAANKFQALQEPDDPPVNFHGFCGASLVCMKY